MNPIVRKAPDETRRRINAVVHQLLGAIDILGEQSPLAKDNARECIVDALTELHGMKLDADELEKSIEALATERDGLRKSLGPV